MKVLVDYGTMPRSAIGQWVGRPLIRRLAHDSNLGAMLLERLKAQPLAAEKATIPRLLAASRGMFPELHKWCREEAASQLRRRSLPEIGFDLLRGEIVPVVETLLEVLDPSLERVSTSGSFGY